MRFANTQELDATITCAGIPAPASHPSRDGVLIVRVRDSEGPLGIFVISALKGQLVLDFVGEEHWRAPLVDASKELALRLALREPRYVCFELLGRDVAPIYVARLRRERAAEWAWRTDNGERTTRDLVVALHNVLLKICSS